MRACVRVGCWAASVPSQSGRSRPWDSAQLGACLPSHVGNLPLTWTTVRAGPVKLGLVIQGPRGGCPSTTLTFKPTSNTRIYVKIDSLRPLSKDYPTLF